MARIRSRVVETESVNQRMLRRGAVKRQHIDQWAVGHDELAPGVVGDRHLHPTAIERIREEAGSAGGGGLSLTLERSTAQSIPSGGAALSLTAVAVGPITVGIDVPALPTSELVMPSKCVPSVLVRFRWDTWRAGGTVRLLRDGVVVDESPASWGTRFAAVLHPGVVDEGQALTVEVDHGDAVAHDLLDVRVALRVEGQAPALPSAGASGMYAVFWRPEAAVPPSFGAFRYDEDEVVTTLGSAAPASTGTSWAGMRVQLVGGLLRARVWLWSDPEPSTWGIDVVDPNPIKPGFVGVSSHPATVGPSGFRIYDTFEVSVDGGEPVFTDFSEYAAGGLPADWNVLAGAGAADWEIHADAAYTGGKALRFPYPAAAGAHVGWTVPGAGSDFDVVIRARCTTVNATVGVVLRGQAT